MTLTELQQAALVKYGNLSVGRSKWTSRLINIRELCIATDLTPTQIQMLEHFVTNPSKVLKNTIYLLDKMIYPVTTNVSTIQITVSS